MDVEARRAVRTAPRPTVSRPSPEGQRRATVARFRPDVEGMRAVAILLVVVYHAGLLGVTGGYVGVDVFFVLSGFLITGLLVDELRRTGSVSILGFYARRARRLLPAATLVLVATVLGSYLLEPSLQHGAVAEDVKAAALYFANWHFAAGATQYSADTDQSVVLHFWSLAVEEQFYLVWPLLMLLVVGRGGLARRHWQVAQSRVVVALAVLGGTSLLLSWLLTTTSGPWAYFGLHTRAWELTAGAGLALARPLLPRIPRQLAVLAGWTGLALLTFAAFRFGPDTAFPGVAAIVPVGATVLLLAAGGGATSQGTARRLAHPVLMYVGRVSYAWYLWHWPVLALAQHRQSSAAFGADELGPALALVLVVASFGLAVATHHLVEQRVRESPTLGTSVGRSLALGAGLTAASVLAAAAVLAPSAGARFLLPGTGSGTTVDADGLAAGEAFLAPPGTTAELVPARTPEQARNDRTQLVRRCGATLYGTEAAADCLYGDPEGSRTVVLAGDSHATQWFPALDRLAKQRHWKLYVWKKSGCSLIDVPLYLKEVQGPYRTCEVWQANVRQRISELPEIDAVVLGRWAGNDEIMLGPDDERLDPADIGPTWRAGADRTFGWLLDASRHVVVLRDNPWPTFSVPTCLARQPDAPQLCDFPSSGHVHLDEPLYQAERAAAGGRSRVSFLDLTSALCPGATCPSVTPDGVVMYVDSNHVTRSLAARLADDVGRRLTALVEAGD